jgi:PAS domain S-box-containing protein
MNAAWPTNEPQRLDALRQLGLLDTPAEAAFDDVTLLAAHVCQTPIALITLVDRDREWFKSRVGMEAKELPREAAFCAHTILQPDELLEVPDALADPRFADNPMVTGAPGVRFYAGAPLVTREGQALGALCVLDTRPRQLTPEQRAALRALRRDVMAEIELRRALAERDAARAQLRASHEQLEARVGDRAAALRESELRESELRESELRESELRLRLLANIVAAYAYAYRVEPDRSLTLDWSMNPQANTGYTARELQALGGFRTIIHPEDRARHRQSLERVLENRADTVDFRIVSKSGAVRWLQSFNRPLWSEAAGRVTGIEGATQDITARQQAEAALRESEARLREILDGMFAFIGLLTPEGVLLEANRAPIEAAGLRRDDMLGRPLRDAYWFAHSSAVREQLTAALRRAAQGETVRYDTTAQVAGGRLITIDVSFAPLHDAEGRVTQMVGSAVDITERKRAEAALRESEERLRAIVENEPECVKVVARDGRLLEMNPAGLAMLEAGSLTEVQQVALVDFIAPEHRDHFRKLHQRVLRGEGGRLEFQVTGLRGTRRWLETHAVPLRDAAGGIYALLGVTRDITDRKRAEAERQGLITQLLESEDAERRRIARELHDSTAQHLAAIKLNLTQLRAANGPTPAAETQWLADSLKLVEQSVQEIRTLTFWLHPPLLDELGLAGAVRDYAAGFGQRSGLSVSADVTGYAGRLPPTIELALFRVVQESLANAHRHSGGDHAAIRLERDAEEVRLEIQDNGRGLTKGVRPGVGLAGMRERLRQLGGRLEIESDAEGTTVLASVPVAEKAE